MKNVVNSALVQVANACDLVVPQLTHSTKCFTKRDVIKALKDWEVQERAAFVYFACHYIKDHLHEEIIGINHQEACEHAFLIQHNYTYDSQLPIKRFKTSIALTFNEEFNDIKQKMVQGLFPPKWSVGVEKRGFLVPKNWKRNPHQYFVHAQLTDYMNEEINITKKSTMVSFYLYLFEFVLATHFLSV
jgi:hypothetical protein